MSKRGGVGINPVFTGSVVSRRRRGGGGIYAALRAAGARPFTRMPHRRDHKKSPKALVCGSQAGNCPAGHRTDRSQNNPTSWKQAQQKKLWYYKAQRDTLALYAERKAAKEEELERQARMPSPRAPPNYHDPRCICPTCERARKAPQ